MLRRFTNAAQQCLARQAESVEKQLKIHGELREPRENRSLLYSFGRSEGGFTLACEKLWQHGFCFRSGEAVHSSDLGKAAYASFFQARPPKNAESSQ